MDKNATMPAFQKVYRDSVAAEVQKRLGYDNPMQIPRLLKITANMGLGEGAREKGVMESALSDMEKITGQKPVVTRARKAIAGFSIREGWLVGCKATLRGARMYEFLERLIKIAIPRIRDFRGFSGKSFDGRGNYSFGISEQIVFPEIDYDNISQLRGLDIAITTTATSDEAARALLEGFKFPFRS
jgi:large subunit ribosomal protein L5